MAQLSIDGLASGLDTTTLITQLMAAERVPVQRLQTKQAAWDAKVAAWGEIAAKVDTLDSALQALDSVKEFEAYKATSSATTRAIASAIAVAIPGSTTIKILSLATAHQAMSRGGYAAATAAVGAGRISVGSRLADLGVTSWSATTLPAGKHTIEVVTTAGGHGVKLDGAAAVDIVDGSATVGGLTLNFGTPTVGTGATVTVAEAGAETTLATLAGQLTAAGGPFSAQVLDLGSGTQRSRLLLSASATGTAAALDIQTDIAGLKDPVEAGYFTDLQPAHDATIGLGDGSQQVTRPTNTVGDLLPGVTLDLLQAGEEPVTVTVARDTDAVVGKVKAIVDALNGVAATMKVKSKSGDGSTSPLRGNGTIRSLTSSLADRVGQQLADPSGVYAFHLLSELGISSTKDGTWTLDETKLRGALATDAGATATALVELTKPLRDWVADVDGSGGSVARAKDGARSQSDTIKAGIAAFEQRLTLKETRYRKQFADLERVLGQLKSQGNWLAGQIANLPTMGS